MQGAQQPSAHTRETSSMSQQLGASTPKAPKHDTRSRRAVAAGRRAARPHPARPARRHSQAARQIATNKREPAITGAKIALLGTIVAAVIGATATIMVALLQRKDSGPTTVTFAPPSHTARVFDTSAVQNDVMNLLVKADPRAQIHSVQCPGDQEVKVGNVFTCTVQLGGDIPAQKVVDITVRSDNGDYEVGHIRDR